MSLPAQNLHDFVLNLLTDDAARSAFATNPTDALAGAGLSDVTPQDIQEVAPLVADYAPAPVADALESVVATLPTNGTGIEGAIAQLQAVADAAHALPVSPSSLPVSVPSLPVSVPSLPVSAPTLTEPARADLPLGTDALPVNASDLPLSTDALPVSAGDLPLDTPGLDSVPSLENADFGAFQTSTAGSADGFAGSIAYARDEVAGAGTAAVSPDGATLASASDSDLGTFAGSGTASADGFAGGLQTASALGTYGVNTTGVPAPVPSLDAANDLGNSLDADALAKSDPAAGTLAGYVSNGGELLAGQVAGGSATLGNYLAGVNGEAVGNAVASGGQTAADHISQGTETVSAHIADAPSVPALPAAPTLPAEVPSHLPVHVTSELPQTLPHLPVANPLPQAGDLEHAITQNPVTDAVSHSPLSDAAGSLDHSALPQTDGLDSLHHDLPLGH
ncbi:IniB N-terminal domain-containing protein [Amycolatopsis sp.]|uniref:IniB N-terminal domain-containing protein n=1 Tax=Amycolatopsis sp. TaxID=37632 RepID=UPI002C0C4283|nr:IniB N-terminal domain-containing protein [Amycolatopsis sp.]HVV12756.1 IniB N-terminal domain-containing protein [Amycolatopsis sp.]